MPDEKRVPIAGDQLEAALKDAHEFVELLKASKIASFMIIGRYPDGKGCTYAFASSDDCAEFIAKMAEHLCTCKLPHCQSTIAMGIIKQTCAYLVNDLPIPHVQVVAEPLATPDKKDMN